MICIPMYTDHRLAQSQPLVFRNGARMDAESQVSAPRLEHVFLHARTHGTRCLSRKAKLDPTCRSEVDSFEQCCTNLRPFVPIPETVFLFHFFPNQKPASPRLAACRRLPSSSLHHDPSANWPRNYLRYLFQKQLRRSAWWLADIRAPPGCRRKIFAPCLLDLGVPVVRKAGLWACYHVSSEGT
jgi:hypothetical protein